MFGIDVHQVGGRVGVNHNRLALALAVHFHAGDGIPAREFYPRGIPKPSLGVNNIEELAGVVDANQDQDEQGPSRSRPPRLGVRRPDGSGDCHAHAGEEHSVRATQPIEQRDNREASQRPAREIGGVEQGNVPGLAREYDGEFQSGDKERNGGSQVNRSESQEVCFRNIQ